MTPLDVDRPAAGSSVRDSTQHSQISSILMSKNIKIKLYRTVILPVVLYGCETLSLTLREERGLRELENRACLTRTR